MYHTIDSRVSENAKLRGVSIHVTRRQIETIISNSYFEISDGYKRQHFLSCTSYTGALNPTKSNYWFNLLFFDDLTVTSIDVTDGLRMTLSDNDVIHLRPSGNAPELRCYAESTSDEKAKQLVVQVLERVVTL